MYIYVQYQQYNISVSQQNMKKSQSAYMKGRALSHASLQKFRNNSSNQGLIPSAAELFNPKPAIKYYSNSNQNSGMSTVAIKQSQPSLASTTNITTHSNTNIHTNNSSGNNRKSVELLRVQQQYKRKIKVLEYELKKKINQNSTLAKIFKTKSTAQLTHLDLYVQFSRLDQETSQKDIKIQELNANMEKCIKQIQDLLRQKQEQESKHVNQIQGISQQLEKLSRKHANQLNDKEKLLQSQIKTRQQKDYLLKEIRKKCQQNEKRITRLEEENKQLRSHKEDLATIYEQKYENMREDYAIKTGEYQNQIEKYELKFREQQQLMKQSHEKWMHKQSERSKLLKRLQNELSSKTKQLSDQSVAISEHLQAIHNLQCELDKHKKQNINLLNELKTKQNTIFDKQSRNQERFKQLMKDVQQKESIIRKLESCEHNMSKQIGKLQSKLQQAHATIKILNYERENSAAQVDKLRDTLNSKEKSISQKTKYIEQLQCKLFTIDRKSTNWQQHIAKLEKQLHDTKQSHMVDSKLHIQNYKCIGRLTQLVHQVQGLIEQSTHNQSSIPVIHKEIGAIKGKNNKDKLHKKEKNTKINIKDDDEDNNEDNNEEYQTLTDCLDALIRQFEVFAKKIHKSTVEESKANKQFIDQIVTDMKSIFHAYNSYVQDEQLKGATRQYLECIDSPQRSTKKSRNCYLQVIMERLISMIAIQSYTSEKGLTRQAESKSKMSVRKHVDSLQNTGSRWDQIQHDDRKQRNHDKQQFKVNKKRGIQSSHEKQQVRVSSKRKSSQRLVTQPAYSQNPATRKLQYKQNYYNRINLHRNKDARQTQMSGFESVKGITNLHKQNNNNNSIEHKIKQNEYVNINDRHFKSRDDAHYEQSYTIGETRCKQPREVQREKMKQWRQRGNEAEHVDPIQMKYFR